MASHTLNIARIRGCPKAAELRKLLADYGVQPDAGYAVLDVAKGGAFVRGTLVALVAQQYPHLDDEAEQLDTQQVEKAVALPFAIWPDKQRLEISAGGKTGIEEVGAFLASELALSTVVDAVEIDLVDAVEKLTKTASRFQLWQATIGLYAASSYVCGKYTPKFIDTDHGLKLLEEYAEAADAVVVRFIEASRVSLTIRPTGCFSFSLKDEEDYDQVTKILRELAGWTKYRPAGHRKDRLCKP